ncbi:MAG: hypothetical protein ACK4GG_04920 [Sphingomonas sp.]
MIVRTLILLALLLGTLPAPSAAAPACHDAPEMTMAMPMDHDAPPPPEHEQAPVMGKMLCVGCIAPATMKAASLYAPYARIAAHGASAPARAMAGALLTPEPPPPRG